MNRRQGLVAVLLVASGATALWAFSSGLNGEPLRTRLIGGFGAGLLAAVVVLVLARAWFRRRG